MDTCSVRGDTVSQTNVLSFARINVVYLPGLGGQLPPLTPRPVRLCICLTISRVELNLFVEFDDHCLYSFDLGIISSRDCQRFVLPFPSPDGTDEFVLVFIDGSLLSLVLVFSSPSRVSILYVLSGVH